MNPGHLLSYWQRLSPWPGGRWLYSRLLGLAVPYSGSIGAVVEQLEAGHAVVSLRDRRAVRNHLHSIHAIALLNLAELTSGQAMLTAVGPTVRGIVTGIRMEYHRKARGKVVAESTVSAPAVTGPTEAEVSAELRDGAGELVATGYVTWLLSPR